MSVQESFPFNNRVQTIIVESTLAECLMAIEAYMHRYLWQGYMTEITQSPENEDGVWTAKIERLASCD